MAPRLPILAAYPDDSAEFERVSLDRADVRRLTRSAAPRDDVEDRDESDRRLLEDPNPEVREDRDCSSLRDRGRDVEPVSSELFLRRSLRAVISAIAAREYLACERLVVSLRLFVRIVNRGEAERGMELYDGDVAKLHFVGLLGLIGLMGSISLRETNEIRNRCYHAPQTSIKPMIQLPLYMTYCFI